MSLVKKKSQDGHFILFKDIRSLYAMIAKYPDKYSWFNTIYNKYKVVYSDGVLAFDDETYPPVFARKGDYICLEDVTERVFIYTEEEFSVGLFIDKLEGTYGLNGGSIFYATLPTNDMNVNPVEELKHAFGLGLMYYDENGCLCALADNGLFMLVPMDKWMLYDTKRAMFEFVTAEELTKNYVEVKSNSLLEANNIFN